MALGAIKKAIKAAKSPEKKKALAKKMVALKKKNAKLVVKAKKVEKKGCKKAKMTLIKQGLNVLEVKIQKRVQTINNLLEGLKKKKGKLLK